MKINPVKQTIQEDLTINCFSGGINKSVPANCIEDNELSEGVNVWHRDGILQKRPGLTPITTSVIWDENVNSSEVVKYKQYHNPIFYNNKEYKVLTTVYSDLYSFERHNVFLIDSEGKHISLGALNFGRIDSTTFYLPYSINFFSGKSNVGTGVFAFVTTYERSGSGKKEYHIYEAMGSDRDWVITTDYYTPTIYVNGHGDSFDFAQQTIAYSSDKKPSEPESVNMLNGRFRAYFSTDGYSSVFRLPVMDLDPEADIICRLYHTPSMFAEWVIPAGESSAKSPQYSSEIILTVDRRKGVFRFTSDDTDYPIPYMHQYKDNNLYFASQVKNENGLENIISCNHSTKNGEYLLFTGGNEKGRLFCSRSDNPLYFPKNSSVCIGDSNEASTALINFKGNTLCFKSNRIYKVSINEGERMGSLFTDINKEFFKPPTITYDNISNEIGTDNSSTICLCSGNLVWLGNDNIVYKTNSLNPESIKNISFKIQDNLSDAIKDFAPFFTECFAVTADGNYILFLGRRAFLLNFSVKGIRYPSANFKLKNDNCAWYYFEFPERLLISGGFSKGNDIFFICGDSEKGTCYLSKFAGENDIIYTPDGNDTYPISCVAATKLFSLGNILGKKIVEKTEIVASGEMDVEYLAPLSIAKYRLISEDYNDLYIPSRADKKFITSVGVRMFGVKFATNKKFALSSISLTYREAFS